ncbi:MAG: hypothetical protein KIS72_04205 [Luteimonas sp.]|nr:hypothetical protein [Luteimonas sp.]
MPMPRRLVFLLRSLLALVLAIVAIPAVNLAGAWLSERVFGLPPGGTLRLAVDLFWVLAAGCAAAWLLVETAVAAKTAHTWMLFAIYLAVGVYGVTAMGSDFPVWFTVGFVVLLPAQAWLGRWLAWGRRRNSRPPP